MCNYFLLFFTILTFVLNLLDLWGNSFDSHFSKETLDKLRLKESSFIRKLIPFKEGPLKDKQGLYYSYRYCLKIRAIPYFISIIAIIVLTPISMINIFIGIIPDLLVYVIALSVILIHLLRNVLISICSQIIGL